MNGCTPEYNQRTRDMQDAFEKLKAQHADTVRNVARQRQVEAQNAALREKVATGDMSRPAKRVPLQYDEGVQKALLEREQLKRQVDSLMQKGDRLNQSLPKRLFDFAHNVHLFNIFTSLMVYPKLAAAVLGGHVNAFLQSGTISLAKMIPAINRLADISERQGAGLTLGGLKARYGAGSVEAVKGAGQTWKTGHSAIEAAYGDPAHASDAYWAHQGTLMEALQTPGLKDKIFEGARVLSSYPGRTHGMVKQFLSAPEFHQSYFDRSLQIQKQMTKQGYTPDQIADFLGKESTKASIGAKALADAYESKMQGKNLINDALLGQISRLSNSDNLGAQSLGFALKTILPVARVGANVFKQGTSLMFGGVKAAMSALAGKGEMTPQRADYILKNIGQQGTGAVMLALGAIYADSLGGIPGTGKPKKDSEGNTIKPDEADINGIPVGAWGFHGAPFAMLQMGAGIRKVFEREQGKQGATDAALTAIGSNLWNWSERTIPEADMIRRTATTLEYARGGDRRHYPYGNPWGEVLGGQLRSMAIPLQLQQQAQGTAGFAQIPSLADPHKGFRSPRNITDDLKLGIPGLREEVPIR